MQVGQNLLGKKEEKNQKTCEQQTKANMQHQHQHQRHTDKENPTCIKFKKRF